MWNKPHSSSLLFHISTYVNLEPLQLSRRYLELSRVGSSTELCGSRVNPPEEPKTRPLAPREPHSQIGVDSSENSSKLEYF